MEHALSGGAFLAGGAAKLPDLCDVAGRELQCQTRFGRPVGIEHWPEHMNDPEWSTAAGLAMYSAKLKVQEQRVAAGWLGTFLK
jgi:cell division protein FtsA